MKYYFILTLFLAVNTSLYASREWKELIIPNTTCGDGNNYKIYLNLQSTEKVAFEFMGGGACWDSKTCKSKNYNQYINPSVIPVISQMSSSKEQESPIFEHSMIYFPYCTGDVYSGTHQSSYTYYHKGYDNIRTTLAFLQSENIIDFKLVNDLFVYGWSAGSIGSMIHLNEFESLVAPEAKRTLILDSPGLHWGDKVWEKLSQNMVIDLVENFSKIGIEFKVDQGNMAHQMDKFCNKFSNWQIGILQGSTDYTMSTKYGAISSKNHKKAVYSDQGILATTAKTNNCKAWVKDTSMHTFLLLPLAGELSVNDVSAREFIFKIYQREVSENIFKERISFAQKIKDLFSR